MGSMIDILIKLYASVLFISALIQWTGPYRGNETVRFVEQITNPVTAIFQSFFSQRSPWPALISMVILVCLPFLFLTNFNITIALVEGLIIAWQIIFNVLFWWILGYVILSWVGFPSHPAIEVLVRVSHRLLAPIRNVLPSFGGIDFSPIALIIGLQLLNGLIFNLLRAVI